MEGNLLKETIIEILKLIPVILSFPVVLLLIVLIFRENVNDLLNSLSQFFNNLDLSKQLRRYEQPQPASEKVYSQKEIHKPAIETSSHVHESLAQAFAIKGSYDEAIAQYNAAINLDPENASAFIGLGNAFHKKNMYAEAIAALERAVQIKPYWADCRCNLGAAYSLASIHDKAIDEFVQAININPNYAAAHYGLGIAYASAGNYNKALEQCETLKELEPHFAEKLTKTVEDAKCKSH